MATEIDWTFVVACGEVHFVGGDAPRLGGKSYYYYGDDGGGGWGDGVFHGDTQGDSIFMGEAEGAGKFDEGGGVSWYR